jgi:histidine triad (HIT) family protein
VVWRATSWVAFFPLNPATPGHTLVVPRGHVTDLWQLGSPLASELIDASIQIGLAIRAALEPEGLNLITSAGAAAEQSVFHLHLHLVPRWHEDGFGHIWPNRGSGTASPDEMVQHADRIRHQLIEQEGQ